MANKKLTKQEPYIHIRRVLERINKFAGKKLVIKSLMEENK